ISVTIRGIKPSVGSSSRMILGSSIIARDGEHLLLTAGERAAGLVAALGQYRKIAVNFFQQLRLSRPAHAMPIEPGAEIFRDRHQGKDPQIFGTVADPEPRQPVRREMGDRLALEEHPAT